MSHPQSSLFDMFSIDLADPFPKPDAGNRFFLVCVEHLSEWPVVSATKQTTAETVVSFMKEKVVLSFGAPRIAVSDNAAYFIAQSVR